MPYHSHWEKRGVLTAWHGKATGDELVAFLRSGQANPQFDAVTYSIHDFSGVESFTYNESEIEEAAVMDMTGALTNPRIRIAVVTDREDVRNMVSAYCTTDLSPYRVRTFTSVPEARSWVASPDA